MNIKQIIWDWNGTLWDDTWLCTEINNLMLSNRGLAPITIEDYRAKLCFPVSDYYSQLGFDYEQDSYKALAEEFIATYEARRFECDLQQGARTFIEHLKGKGISQAVLSAYQQDALLEAVTYFELNPFFDEVIGLNDIYAAGKVENGLKYMEQLNVNPHQVLFVGDTIHDFEVASAMGVQCALVENGHNSRARLQSCGVPVYASLSELQQLFA